MFRLGEGKENTMKSWVNGLWRVHGNKHAESVKMKGSEDMPRKFSQIHAKRDMC